jgi:hypothetical protein
MPRLYPPDVRGASAWCRDTAASGSPGVWSPSKELANKTDIVMRPCEGIGYVLRMLRRSTLPKLEGVKTSLVGCLAFAKSRPQAVRKAHSTLAATASMQSRKIRCFHTDWSFLITPETSTARATIVIKTTVSCLNNLSFLVPLSPEISVNQAAIAKEIATYLNSTFEKIDPSDRFLG